MCLCWIVGLFGATSGCSTLSYLRGSHPPGSTLALEADDPQAPAMARTVAVLERARLQALGERHREAFPLSVAQLLLGMLLVLASGAALAGRRNARNLALQVIAVNALIALVEWVLMSPVRDAMAQALAADGVDHGLGLVPELTREQSIEWYRAAMLWAERARFALLELGVFGGAAVALTRERTRRFFAAVAQATDDGPSDQDEPLQ